MSLTVLFYSMALEGTILFSEEINPESENKLVLAQGWGRGSLGDVLMA